MAEEHFPTAAQAASPIDVNLIDSALHSMTGLINLAEWIGHARGLIEGIETRKRHSPDFAQQLRSCDFATAHVDWDEDAAEGMDCLHYVLREHIEVISKAVRAGGAQ